MPRLILVSFGLTWLVILFGFLLDYGLMKEMQRVQKAKEIHCEQYGGRFCPYDEEIYK